MTASKKNAPAPAATGNEGEGTNTQEGTHNMSIVQNTTDTTTPSSSEDDTSYLDTLTPCTTYAWCDGHGGMKDDGESSPEVSHIGSDVHLDYSTFSGWLCPQIDPRSANGIALAVDCDIVLTSSTVDDFERAMTEVIAKVRRALDECPEVSA